MRLKFLLLILLSSVFFITSCTPWQRTEERIITKLEVLSLEIEETQRLYRESMISSAASQAELRAKLEELDRKIASLEDRIQNLEDSSEELIKKFESLDLRIRSFDVEITKLEDEMARLDRSLGNKIETVRVRQDEALQEIQQVVELLRSSHEGLEARLQKIERDLANLEQASEEMFASSEGHYKQLLGEIASTKKLLNESFGRTTSSLFELKACLEELSTSTMRKFSEESELLNDLFAVSTDIDRKLTVLPLLSSDLKRIIDNQEGLRKTVEMMTQVVDLEGLKSSIDEIKLMARFMESAASLQATETIEHVVKPGETLQTIAKAYGVTVGEILKANPSIKDPSKIFAYQKLLIPVSVEEALSASALFERHIKAELSWEKLQEVVIRTFGDIKEGYANIGVDLHLDPGEVLTSPLGGRIEFAGYLNEAYGNVVKLSIGVGNYILFGKLEEVVVKTGDMVQAGDAIGRTGVSEINLHLEIWKNGVPLDPLTFFFRHAGELHVTMYTEWDDGKPPIHPTFKRTATGGFVRAYRTVAADFRFLPPGSIVYIPFFKDWPNRGFFVVEDTGGAVVGKKIDVFVHDPELASRFSRYLDVYIVTKSKK
ncbi:MAG: hypothetical protein PWP09_806 [Thermotogota bacterium]|nr:hypothetical protein [Thermotogota bacterium]